MREIARDTPRSHARLRTNDECVRGHRRSRARDTCASLLLLVRIALAAEGGRLLGGAHLGAALLALRRRRRGSVVGRAVSRRAAHGAEMAAVRALAILILAALGFVEEQALPLVTSLLA